MTVKQSITGIIAAAAIGGGVYEGTVSDGPVNVVREGELVSQRTETAVVYDEGNGRKLAHVYTKPIHWRDGKTWKTIDTAVKAKPILRQLVSSRDYETTAGPYTADYETDKPYNYRMVAGGATVAYTARFDTTKAVTVTVEPTTTGVKETVILADETAPTRLDWTVETDAVFTARGDGGFTADGLTIEPPVAWDAGGAAIPVTASLDKGTYMLTVETKGAAWPVTVDPTTRVVFPDIDDSSGNIITTNSTFLTGRNATTGTVNVGNFSAHQQEFGSDYYTSRAVLSINTSSLTSAASIDSAKVTLVMQNKYGGLGSIYMIQSTASGSLGDGWYNDFTGWAASGTYTVTTVADTFAVNTYANGDSIRLRLNATGKSSISKTGTTYFHFILGADRLAIPPPNETIVGCVFGDDSPYMEVWYTIPVAVPVSRFIMTPLTPTSIKVEWIGATSGLDSLILKNQMDSTSVENLNKAANADTITGLNPYTKYRWFAESDTSGAFANSANADSCWTTSEATTVTINQPSSRYHETHSPVYNVARAVTSPDSIGGDVLSSAGYIGQYLDSDKYIWRISLNDALFNYTRIISGSIKVTGVEDGSTTDFTVRVFRGTWSAGDQIDDRHHEFSGWKTGATAYDGTSLIDTWTTASYGAAITWSLTRGGIDQLLTARGDTLRLAILSSRDVAATAPGGSEYIRVQAPYLSLTVDLPDSIPTGFTMTAVDTDSIAITWNDRAHSEYGYVIKNTLTDTQVAGTDTLAANSESAGVGGLTPNTLYSWYIMAVGGGAHGMESVADSTYTLAAAPVTAPTLTFPAPDTLKVVIDTSGTGNPDYTEYALQDSASGLYWDAEGDSLRSGLTVNDDWGWQDVAGWGAIIGSLLGGIGIGKKYVMRAKARSGRSS